MSHFNLACKICFKLHDKNISPSLLPCGHTCCEPCLTKILQDTDNRKCYMCKEPNLKQTEANKTMKDIFMAFFDEDWYAPWSIESLRSRLEVLSKEHKRVLSSAKEIASIVMGNMSKISLMESDENKILEFIGKEEGEIETTEVHEALDTIEKLMNEVAELFPIKNARILSFSTSYNLIDFPDNSEFLTKICKEVGNGQKIRSLLSINETRNAAKISISNNMVLVHAFRPSSRSGRCKLPIHVEFSDLKKCLLQQQLYGFLNLSYDAEDVYHRVFIKIFTQSILVSKFLKLCTGEAGPSYLESTYQIFQYSGSESATNINEMESFFIDGGKLPQKLDWDEQYHEYISGLPIDCSGLSNKDYYLSLETNGTFQISKTEKISKGSTVIGTVKDSSLFIQQYNYDSNGIVIDCGIAVML